MQVNPRCPRQTTIMLEDKVYLFDGFYLLCHCDPPEVPRVSDLANVERKMLLLL